MTVPKINSAHGAETRNIINRAIDTLNKYGIAVENIVTKGQLTPGQFIQLMELVNDLARKGDITDVDLASNLRAKVKEIDNKADIDYVDEKVGNVASGSPSGVFSTLTALRNEYPNGADGIYVVTGNGNWYWYNGTSWVSGGIYQETRLSHSNQDKIDNVPNLNEFVSGDKTGVALQKETKIGMSEWVLDNAHLNQSTDDFFWLTSITGYAGIAYTSTNKISFTAYPNVATLLNFVVGSGNNSYTIVQVKSGQVGRVIESTKRSSTYVQLKAKDDTLNPPELGDVIAGELKDNLFIATIKRAGRDSFSNWFSIDLSAISGANGFNQNPLFGLATDYNTARVGSDVYAMNEGGVFELGNNLSEVVVKQSKEIEGLKELIQSISGSDGDSRWTAKTMNILGDSFTQRNLYPPVIKDALGLATINGYGSSGNTITLNEKISNPFSIRYTSMTNTADLILVQGGVNDYGNGAFGSQGGVPIGAKNSRDIETFRGALRILIEGLLTKYKTQKIAFVTPIQMNEANSTLSYKNGKKANSKGHHLIDHVDAMLEICAEYGIPCLDMYRTFGLHELNMTEWSLDGLHLNQHGSEYYGQKVAEFLKGI